MDEEVVLLDREYYEAFSSIEISDIDIEDEMFDLYFNDGRNIQEFHFNIHDLIEFNNNLKSYLDTYLETKFSPSQVGKGEL